MYVQKSRPGKPGSQLRTMLYWQSENPEKQHLPAQGRGVQL